jgi:hypothetical protein
VLVLKLGDLGFEFVATVDLGLEIMSSQVNDETDESRLPKYVIGHRRGLGRLLWNQDSNDSLIHSYKPRKQSHTLDFRLRSGLSGDAERLTIREDHAFPVVEGNTADSLRRLLPSVAHTLSSMR